MQAADLKVRLGQSDQALHDFETMLGKLRPDSWLHREVRRKIEEVFLRNDDQAGLVSYYERWTKKEPEDVEALVRLGRTLAGMGRAAEAQPWYEKAIKLAPTRRDLRLALISSSTRTRNSPRPPRSTQALDQAEPNNPDTLRDWGALVLRDTAKTPSRAQGRRGGIWRKLLVAEAQRPVTTAQVADLLRQAEMVDDALALYNKAVELAPTNPQYHEYLGEYLHNLKRPDEAKAAWAKIAEGPNKNAKNLARLAEVLAGFGYVKEAIPPLTEAVDARDRRLRPPAQAGRVICIGSSGTTTPRRSWPPPRKLAEQGRRERRPSWKLASRTTRPPAGSPQRIEALRKELDATRTPRAERWSVLARYLEADGKLPEAVRAADRAIADRPALDPGLDPGRPGPRVGRQPGRRRRRPAAAGRDRPPQPHRALDGHRQARIAAGPDRRRPQGRPRPAGRRAGQPRELRVLRPALLPARPVGGRARRLAPGRPGQPQRHQDHAHPGRDPGRPVPDRGSDRDVLAGLRPGRRPRRTSSTSSRKLTELYLQRNQFDRLLTRLQHQERDDRPAAVGGAAAAARRGHLHGPGSTRPRATWAAPAPSSSGCWPPTPATPTCSSSSPSWPRKRETWRAPPGIRSSSTTWPRATRACRGWRNSMPAPASSRKPRRSGRRWPRARASRSASTRRWTSCSSNQKPQPVLEITESMLRKDPRDWEALYRSGVALAAARRSPKRPRRRFRGSARPDDRRRREERFRQGPRTQPAGFRPPALASRDRCAGRRLPLEDRIGMTYSDPHALQARSRRPHAGYAWSPDDFGQARMAALGWLLSLSRARARRQADEVVAGYPQGGREDAGRRSRALELVLSLPDALRQRRRCSRPPASSSRAAATDPLALWAYLHALGGRQAPAGPASTSSSLSSASPQDGRHAAAGQGRARSRDGLLSRRSEPAAPSWRRAEILMNISDELKRAKRLDEEEAVLSRGGRRRDPAGPDRRGLHPGRAAGRRRRADPALRALRPAPDRPVARPATPAGSFSFVGPGLAMCQGMSALADRKDYADVLRLVDFNLASARQEARTSVAGRGRARSALATRARRITGYVPMNYTIWIGTTYSPRPDRVSPGQRIS